MCLLCTVDCVLKLWKIIRRRLATLKLYFLLLILRKLINLEITCHKKVGKIPSKLFSPFPALSWCPTCLLVCGGGGQVRKFKICKYDNTIIIWSANLKHKMAITRKLYKERQTNTFYTDINQILHRSQKASNHRSFCRCWCDQRTVVGGVEPKQMININGDVIM